MTTTLQEALLDEVGRLLQPLTAAADSDAARQHLLGALGLDLSVVPNLDPGPLISALQQVVTLAEQLESAPGPLTLQEAIDGLSAATNAFVAIRGLVQSLSTSGLPSDLVARLAEAGDQLVAYLVTRWLHDAHPRGYAVLHVLGLFDQQTPSSSPVAVGTSFAYLPTPRTTLNAQRLLQLLHDPVGTLKGTYLNGQSGQAAVDALAGKLWPVIVEELLRNEWPITPANNPELQAFIGTPLGAAGAQLANATLLLPVAFDTSGNAIMLDLTLLAGTAPGERSVLVLGVDGEISQSVSVGAWTLAATVQGAARALAIDSAGTILVPSGADPSQSLSLSLTVSRAADAMGPALRVGGANGSRVEIGSVALTLHIDLSTTQPASVQLELAASDAQVVVDFSDGDGFLRYLAETLLGGPVHATADVALGWSRQRGVYLHAGGSAATNGPQQLQARIPADLDLGPVRIPALTIGANPSGTDLVLSAGIEATVSLGPVVATIVGLGLRLDLRAPATGGNLGPLDLQLAVQPPTGIGLSITGPDVEGTGFLEPGPEAGDYLGAIDLKLGDVTISGVGVLTTRLPSGPGFSLVVLASVAFPPIDLGFGFALVGIGGLLGVNRTMDVPKLQQLARAGSLDAVMFPADLAHNAPRVAHDLGTYFPPANGQLVIGPTARLTWGESACVTADLAVLVELPVPIRVAVLGTVHLTLPTPDTAVADITLDVLGVVDLAADTLSLDAALRRSRLGGLTLTGQAAIRARFGSDPTVVLAIGGFNPHFAVPAGFPSLNRIALASGSDTVRLRLAAYFAMTPNTLQFGATADLSVAVGPQNGVVVVASLVFDALVQHKPLLMQVDLTVSAAVLVGGSPLVSILLDLHVVGPDPWQVSGQATIHVLGWSVSVPISLSIGTPAPPLPPVRVDLLARLSEALGDPRNWQTNPPAGPGVVALRGGVTDNPLTVHPLGRLSVRERVVPLRVIVDRLGPDALATPCTLDVVAPHLNSVAAASDLILDYFAPAQFVTLSDSAKLSAPSFEPMGAGLTIGTDEMQVPDDGTSAANAVMVTSTRTWTTLTVDVPDVTAPQGQAVRAPSAMMGAAVAAPAPGLSVSLGTATAPSPGLVARQLGGAAAALHGGRGRGAAAYADAPSGVSLTPPSYAAARPDARVTLAPVTDSGGVLVVRVPSYVETIDRIASTPGRPPTVQVVYNSELPGSTAAAGIGA